MVLVYGYSSKNICRYTKCENARILQKVVESYFTDSFLFGDFITVNSLYSLSSVKLTSSICRHHYLHRLLLLYIPEQCDIWVSAYPLHVVLQTVHLIHVVWFTVYAYIIVFFSFFILFIFRSTSKSRPNNIRG